jgi:hypothetical protein
MVRIRVRVLNLKDAEIMRQSALARFRSSCHWQWEPGGGLATLRLTLRVAAAAVVNGVMNRTLPAFED